MAILDVCMPKKDGIHAAHEIRKRLSNTAIIIISSYDDLTFVSDLMRNGVERKAYLIKHSISDVTSLISVVEAVYQGNTVLDSGLVQQLARLSCKYSGALDAAKAGIEQICSTLHLERPEAASHTASLYQNLGIYESDSEERRIMAVRTFVSQIHKIPLGRVYTPVS